jgi:hypothetical protein
MCLDSIPSKFLFFRAVDRELIRFLHRASSSPPETSSSSFSDGSGVSYSSTATSTNESPSILTNSGSATTTSNSPSQGGKGGSSISEKIALGIGIDVSVPAILGGMPSCLAAMRKFGMVELVNSTIRNLLLFSVAIY